MNGNEMWVAIWRAVIAGAALAIASIAGCTANTAYQKRVVLQQGVDPVLVGCAYSAMSDSARTVCAIAAARDRK